MNFISVSDVLGGAGLDTPHLNVLTPNVDNYTALLLQPAGSIEASRAGVRSRDRTLAHDQHTQFLKNAYDTGADLVVTPEYSMRWDVLISSLKAGIIPEEGKLWALGCESIQYEELEKLKTENDDTAQIIFERLEKDNERFVSPLAYVFKTRFSDGDDSRQTVILVQFKTHPMGDPDHYEVNALQRGVSIYRFGGGE